MAGNHYYFIASLPELRFGQPPELTVEEFLARAGEQLSPEQHAVLTAIGRVPRERAATSVEARWNAWETALRNQAARLRAVRRNQEPDDYLRPETDAFANLDKQVMEAFDDTNPAEERRQLDTLRWRFLNDLEVGHEFDFERLVVYLLKLILLEKWAGLSREEGRAELERVVAEKIPELDFAEQTDAQ